MKTIYSVILGLLIGSAATVAFGQPPYSIHDMKRVTKEERAAILKALPDKAPAQPRKQRRLLVYDVNASYGGHEAITYANFALEQMGKKTGAFEMVRSVDAKVFEWDSLKTFDGIFINNIVGAPFEEKKYFDNIIRFVKEGGGLMGVHGSTAAFILWGNGPHTDLFPEFGEMLGGRDANHRAFNENIHVKVEEPNHPLTSMFPAEGFRWSDEYFRFPTIYSREKLRVLLSIDVQKSPLPDSKRERADEDYGIAWLHAYGKGRVFYCSLAHKKDVFFNSAFLKFYLGATQYILGDYVVPDQPLKK